MRQFLGKSNQKSHLTFFDDNARLKAHRVKRAEVKSKQKTIYFLASAILDVLSKKNTNLHTFINNNSS